MCIRDRFPGWEYLITFLPGLPSYFVTSSTSGHVSPRHRKEVSLGDSTRICYFESCHPVSYTHLGFSGKPGDREHLWKRGLPCASLAGTGGPADFSQTAWDPVSYTHLFGKTLRYAVRRKWGSKKVRCVEETGQKRKTKHHPPKRGQQAAPFPCPKLNTNYPWL